MIFDGKAFAKEIEGQVATRLRQDYGGRRKPKIVSVLVGNDPASELYTRLKEQAAQRVGIEFEVQRISNIEYRELQKIIEEVGEREEVTGVMVQLPLPEGLRGETPKLLEAIPLGKDVDGLRWRESGVKPATVRAVLSILEKIAADPSATRRTSPDLWRARFVVLGSRGAVGEPLVYFLRQRGVEVTEVEWDTPDPTRSVLAGEVVISCVGKVGLVTGEMVTPGAIVVDVGMSANQRFGESANQPKVVGDMTAEVYAKASVAVPVPGGVGPVTIACLMENVVELV